MCIEGNAYFCRGGGFGHTQVGTNYAHSTCSAYEKIFDLRLFWVQYLTCDVLMSLKTH